MKTDPTLPSADVATASQRIDAKIAAIDFREGQSIDEAALKALIRAAVALNLRA